MEGRSHANVSLLHRGLGLTPHATLKKDYSVLGGGLQYLKLYYFSLVLGVGFRQGGGGDLRILLF